MDFEKVLVDYEGLVKSIANNYINRGLSKEDLIQNGNIGLWEAQKRYDKEKNTQFSTYATYWIRAMIEDALAELSDISKYRIKQIGKMKKAINDLSQELDREPTDIEIASKLEVPLEKIEELKKLSQQSISLDKTIDSEDNATISDFIADKSMTPEEQLIHEEEKRDSQLINEAFLKTLLPHERYVYFLRNKKKLNLTKTAEKLGVYRKRIIDIENNISEKLALFFKSEEYIKLTSGKSEEVLKKIIEEYKKNIDASAKGEKIAKFENYENLKEIDFKDLLNRFQDEYETVLKFPTFGAHFRDICKTKNITYTTFYRATGLSESQFSVYKSDNAKPSISSLVALGIYFKISTSTINTLVELAGYRFKVNDKTHMAYMFVLEHLKGYPIEYCNKVLELLGVEEDKLLKSDKKKRKK